MNYSSNDDDDNYHQEIKDEAHLIEYSDAKEVTHGRRQTNSFVTILNLRITRVCLVPSWQRQRESTREKGRDTPMVSG